MTDEINFCPFCDAPSHKIVVCKDKIVFCKECNRFYEVELLKLSCPKCKNIKILDAEFPDAQGRTVFQCAKCKKMFSSDDFFEHNNLK